MRRISRGRAEVGSDRRGLDGDVVSAQGGGGLVGVGRAADVLEQGGVVDVGGFVDPQLVRQPDGEHAGPGRLSGFHPHADVGHEGEPHQQLREPEVLSRGRGRRAARAHDPPRLRPSALLPSALCL